MSEDGPTGQAGNFFALVGPLRAFKVGPLGGHPSDRALAEAADVSATTIGEWLRGSRFPQDPGKILTVVRMVRDAAARRGITAPPAARPGCWKKHAGGRRGRPRPSGEPVRSRRPCSAPRRTGRWPRRPPGGRWTR